MVVLAASVVTKAGKGAPAAARAGPRGSPARPAAPRLARWLVRARAIDVGPGAPI